MATLTKDDRRRGLEYANRVAQLAKEAPDFFSKRQVYKAADAMRRFYAFSIEEKKRRMCRLLQIGCSTYADLVNEMVMPKQEVIALVDLLVKAKHVRLTEFSVSTGGRRATHIAYIGPETDFVTPKI